jgi:alkylation response protein AidB-like acyl-CoA dehydrogenase
MDAWIYAMEAMTTVTASLIDRGLEDYMLETAMLKVYCTERLWTIVNDAFQIHGGAAYFTDRPLERMLRDHRINQIGEGANEVLISFIALSGMRGPGLQLKRLHDTVKRPWRNPTEIARFIGHAAVQRFVSPTVPVRCAQLRPYAQRLGQSIRRLGLAAQRCLIRHGEEIVERQLVQQRLAWAAMEIFASATALSRWDDELARHQSRHNAAARLLLMESSAEIRYWLDQLRHNHDDAIRDAAAYVADDRLVCGD